MNTEERMQRLQRISPTPEVAEALHGLGYTSAHQIATGRESQFLLKAAPALQDLVPGKSGRQVAHAVYQAAQAVRSKTWSLALAAQSTSNGSVIGAISAKQQQPDFSQGMPTYERLFGPMIGCDCEDCQSIWGPGAYFVDLMNVVQEYITEPSSDTLQPEFALQMRRPDLWDLLIDCANANTEVGYLEIVNGVLRRNLSTNYLDGKDAVEYLASASYPMDAPYNMPLEETRLALEQSGTSLAAIYRALHLPAPAEAEAILNLSPEQSSIVTGQNLPSLATLYGFRDADAAVWEALTWQPLFLQRTGITPKELEEMIYQDLRRQSENVVAFFSDMNAATAGSVSTGTLSGDQTVEFWFYGAEAFAVDGITPITMYTGSGASTDITFQVVINGSGNIFYYFGPGDPNGTPGDGGDFHLGMGVSILPNQWYHIAFTRDIASQTATGYLNGLQKSQVIATGWVAPSTTSAPITMGQSYGAGQYGYISEMRVWNVVRSQSEIQGAMSQRLDPALEQGLVSYWRCDEGSGSVLKDLGSNGFDLTFSSPASPTWRTATSPFRSSEWAIGLAGEFFLNGLLGGGSYLDLRARSLQEPGPAMIAIAATSYDANGNAALEDAFTKAWQQVAQMKHLQTQLPWRWQDLDWALKSVATAENATENGSTASTTINSAMLEQLALAKVIMERYQLSVDEACALWFDMKTYGRGDGDTPQDLWDRVWNTPPLMAKDASGKQPPYYRPVYAQNPLFTSTPIAIKWSDSAEGSLMVQAGMSRALGLGHADLRLLADSLSSHSKQQQEEQGLTLDVPTMSALYRHARLAQILKLPIREFLQLLSLLTDQKMLTKGSGIWTVAEVTTICDTAEWLRQAGITVPQLAHLLTGQVQEGARPVLTAQRMEQALERIRAASASVRLNADSFISDSIDAARSQAIHDQLVQDGFIDLQGLVSNTLEINQSAIYTSLITDPERREAIFLANPLRQVAYLQNENPDGTITLPFDPFSDPVIQSTNCFTICLWINSDTNRTMTWPSFITWNQSTDQQTQSPTITQQSGTLGQVAFTYSQQGGSGRTGLWLPNFIERSFEWIHVAWVVKDGAWTIYRNGQEFPGVDMVMNKPPYAQQSGIPDYPVGYGFGNLLTGGVADVGIWNVALTEQEVRSVIQSNPGELSNGLIGYWPVDEGSGTTIHDLSGSSEGQDGVLSGTYKWEAIPYLPGNSLASSVSDILLQALQAQNALAVDGLAAHAGLSTEVMAAVADLTGQCVPLYSFPTFNGDGDYMQVPYAANLNGSNISIGMFIKPTGAPDTERILISSLDQSNPAATKGYQVSLNAQNQVVFTIGTGGSSYCTMTSPRSIKANVWTSIVALAGGGQMSLYINFLDGEVLYGQPAYVPNATEMLYLGAGLDSSEVIGGFFEGHITLVAISDTLSNNNAFLLNYKKLLQGQTPDLPALTAFWKLNDPQPSSVTVPDASGNGNEGTLENAKQSSVSITYTPYPVNELLNLLPRNNPQRFPYLLQLAVNTQLAKLLRLTATEVNSITEQASALGTTGIGYAQPLLSLRQLQTLTELKAMTRAWGDATNQTLEYLRLANSNNPDASQVNALLALITGWTASDISTLLGILSGFPGAETLNYAQTVAQLWDMSEIMAATDKAALSLQGLLLIGKLPGLSLTAPASGTDPWQTYLAASQVASGSNGTTNDATSQSALRDRLARLLIWELNATVRGIRNMDDLYEYLLIDVRMGPEVKTSYLVSAMNSLQLYVNRCYNNQEPGVMNEVPERWWEWMSSYRVWQANREVYLYPENYVDPSLRKFASPQFKTLLNAISKGQVTEENAQAALAQYLQEITPLADMFVVDAYTMAVPNGQAGVNLENAAITFVAGRTAASPPKFYVRKVLTYQEEFGPDRHQTDVDHFHTGPWEEIGLSINSEYVTLGHSEGKLLVFWVQQSQETFTNSLNKQCQAVYATIQYSYRSLEGNWVAPMTLKDKIMIGYDQIDWRDLNKITLPESSMMLTNLGMWSANRIIPYNREKSWNKVIVMPAGNASSALIIQLGAMGMPTASQGQLWSNENNGQPSTLPHEEIIWNQTCIAASNIAVKFPTTNTSISFLPAWRLTMGAGVEEVPFVIKTNGDLYMLESSTSYLWNRKTIGMMAGWNPTQTSSLSANANLSSYWPMSFTSGTIVGTEVQDVIAGYNGIISGTVTTKSSIGFPNGAWQDMEYLQMNGSNLIALDFDAYALQTNFTFSCLLWVPALPTSGQQAIAMLAEDANNSSTGWTLTVDSSGYVWLYFWRGSYPTALGYPSNIQVQAGKWCAITLVVSDIGSNPSFLSIDGAASTLDTRIFSSYLPPSSSCPLLLGNITPGVGMNDVLGLDGVITNVRYWNTALTPMEVAMDYYSILDPILTDLPQGGTSGNGVGNSLAMHLLNLSGQPYMASIGQSLGTLKANSTLATSNGAMVLTCDTPTEEMAFPLKYNLVRLGSVTVPSLAAALNDGGVDALMKLPNQYLPEQDLSRYYPSTAVNLPGGSTMDFNGGFGLYFWELFFYAPYLIAEKLRANQQYAEAERWYKYVFNPTAPKAVQAYWPLEGAVDEGAVSMDVAGGYAGTNFDIALAPAAGMPFAFRTRNVYKFNGTSSYIQVPAADTCYLALNPPQFTLGAWVYVNPPAQGAELPEWQSVVTSRGGGTGYILYVHTAGGKSSFHFWVGNGQGWTHCTDNSTLSYGQWYWVVCTSEDGTMNLYVNGALHAQTTGVVFVQNTDSPLRIGAGTTEGIPNLFLGGMIADVGLWNTVLTAGEIGAMYSDYPYQRLSNRFWNFAPFRRLNAESLYHILRGDKYGSLVDPNDPNAFTVVQPADHYTAHLQMSVYQYDPFDPDAIARLRVNSYQKAVFMRYIENLTAWGDALFTQNTWESLTDATMHYVLAADLFGRLPVKEVTTAEQPPASYQDMVNMYGEGKVPDFLINMESEVQGYGSTATIPEQVQSVISAYFCIPVNTQLLGLWKTVADRLYKLRHGLNLAGQPNVIPLFAPPIDPAALVAASNSGVSLTVAGNTPPVPAYRFSYLIQQAKALVGSVMQMGNELLAALEKQDAEQLAELQAGYQVTLSQMSLSIKAAQVNQLISSDHALHASLRSATYVRDTYQNYLKHGLNAEEIIALASAGLALLPMAAAEGVRVGAAIAYLFPNVFGLANGGMQFGESVNVGASALEGAAQILNAYGQLAATMGQYLRRREDWTLQKNIANYQVHEINAQIQANQFALEAAKKDYEITQAQYEQSQHILNFLTTKFTNVELYQWMSGQVGSIYFQMYQLAYAMAQSAQVAYQYETNTSQNFLNPAAWNSLYQGLLAGDTLNLSLSQMESAFVTNARRPLHVRKTYSLRQQNPVALLQLLETGSCRFELSELLYDLDFPGQYNRKIKTLSVSIPAVVGPYQNIHATLTQTHNTVVTKPSVAAVEYLCGQSADMPLDGSIRSNWAPGQQIVISTGVNDSGVFQVNLDDPQYLPFEGTGAVSGWALSIPQAANGFPLRSISDVILSVEYTAQDGGLNYRNALTSSIRGLSSYDGMLYLSLKQLFGGAWFNFLSSHNLPIEIVQQMFAANLNPSSITLGNASGEAYLYPIVAEGIDLGTALQAMSLQDLSGPSGNSTPAQPWTNGYPYNVSIAGTNAPVPLSGKANWNIAATIDAGSALLLPDTTKINPAAWLDLVLVLPYSGTLSW